MSDYRINRKKILEDLSNTFDKKPEIKELVKKRIEEFPQQIEQPIKQQKQIVPLTKDRINTVLGRDAAMRELKQNERTQQQIILDDIEDKLNFAEGDEREQLQKRFNQIKAIMGEG